MDEYSLLFERYANVRIWFKRTWAVQLNSLLTGMAAKVYNRLSPREAMDYDRLNVALLIRNDFTERGCHERFREAKPENHEISSQFMFRLKIFFPIKWEELAVVEQTYFGVVDIIVNEQFTNSPAKG